MCTETRASAAFCAVVRHSKQPVGRSLRKVAQAAGPLHLGLVALTLLSIACSGSDKAYGRPGQRGGTGGTGGTELLAAGGADSGLVITTPDAGGAGAGISGYRTNKVDLLFMIDNSASMADKQQILAETIPDLIGRMATPDCITSTGARVGASTIDGKCPSGSALEFKPVTDIHIGVLSSSLGGHGSPDYCASGAPDYNASQTDMAHLLNRKSGGGTVATYQNLGFLSWDPAQLYGGDTDLTTLEGKFSDLVVGAGEQGCGFEAQLEAAYRFLIDPDPYQTISLTGPGTPPAAELAGTDQVVLDQRKNFLRPDSLLAIFTVSDENDCSLIDGSQYYVALENKPLWRATSQCITNPNDPCCQSCAETKANTGCPDLATDSECKRTGGQYDTTSADPIALRCFDQKRRYGIDMLYPVERYIAGVQNQKIVDRHGKVVANPIYSDLQCGGTNCKPPRPRSFVFWVGIVGVPWQDIAVDPTDLSKGLLTAQDLKDQGRWKVIVGDPSASPPVLPTDPLMIESIAPRSGTNPITMTAIAPPDSPEGQNPINGHEYLPWQDSDLQYACIFPLPAPRDCSNANLSNVCDCAIAGQDATAVAQTKSPLCQARSSTTTDTTQRFAKAYPGIRILQVLEGIDPAESVIASICPANLSDKTSPAFGYRPVVPPLMDKLKKVLEPVIK